MIDKYLIYFFVLSFIGYIYESTVMTFWMGKWDNRGFLFGPVIPIYGTGALFGTILFEYYLKDVSMLQVFLISMFGSAVLEYVVHYTMEKMFNAYWWDYSKAPLNINGRICLPASIGFGIAGLIIIYIINPYLLPLINNIDETLLHIITLILVILFTVDFTLTISILSSFIKRIESLDNFINEHMESLVGNVLDESDAINYRFYNAMDKLSKTRKNLIDDRIERVISSMSNTYRDSISKIKGFRGKNAEKMNYMLEKLKY